MKVNAERLWKMHEQAAALTDPESPYTRRSFTPLYRQMRTWLSDTFADIGLTVKTDAAGNLLGIYEGTGERFVGVGSHTDTVPAGGRFDGISGVLSFVEAAHCLKEAGIKPAKSIIGIDFLSEEPSEFRLSCIGSRLATGNFSEEMLGMKHRETGVILKDAINDWGGDTSLISPGQSLFDADKFDGFLELHIEQGPILVNKQLDVGLVTGICSVTRYDFTVTGRADHAGNTPMDMRSDAVAAAAMVIAAISVTARKNLLKGPYYTATVGRADVFPNASNVIAERVEFSLDIRCEDNSLVKETLVKIFEAAETAAEQTGTKIENKKISQNRPAKSDESLLSALENNARQLDLKYMRMLSGAGHDAAYISTIMPMAMIFIPCEGGRSHTAEEFSSKGQIAKGADLLLNTLLELTT